MRTREPTGATILVVEDDPDIADALTTLLADAGYTAHREPAGRPALARLRRHLPDLLLLDLGLPDIDGIEVCRLAREHAPDLPIVILTARDETRHLVAGFAEGADDYIGKPFDREVLLARIAAVLRGHATGRGGDGVPGSEPSTPAAGPRRA